MGISRKLGHFRRADKAMLNEESPVSVDNHLAQPHRHAEAFHLMRYCRRCNQEATHVEWNRDVYAPNHQPKPGDRIFVNLTEQRARAEAQRLVAERWDKEPSPYRELFPDGTQEDATEKLVQRWLSQPGQPHLEEFRP